MIVSQLGHYFHQYVLYYAAMKFIVQMLMVIQLIRSLMVMRSLTLLRLWIPDKYLTNSRSFSSAVKYFDSGVKYFSTFVLLATYQTAFIVFVITLVFFCCMDV